MKIRALAAIGAGGRRCCSPAAAAAPRPSAAAPTPAAAPQTLTVLAAASLTETFTALGKQFETDNPGRHGQVQLRRLVRPRPADRQRRPGRRLRRGQRRDDEDRSPTRGLTAGEPVIFAKNVLQIATAPGNPKGIATFADLARPDLKVVVCAPQVPCGAAASRRSRRPPASTLTPVSEEPDVKSVLGKVTTGDADAGLVYVTDVDAAGDKVQGVTFPEASPGRRPTTRSRCSRTRPQPDLANQFRHLVTGEQGQKALEQAGFADAVTAHRAAGPLTGDDAGVGLPRAALGARRRWRSR